MGCIISTSRDKGGTKEKPRQGGEFFFVLDIFINKCIDFGKSLKGYMSEKMVEHLSALWI